MTLDEIASDFRPSEDDFHHWAREISFGMESN
jgi:hypothetical protein